ncbi:6-phospho-beta-glucosidase [Clostridium septicum]|uniref:6-phospho-beta-glucosidase n=1 Tax=Clostridium septicum TaxID=1504 RepID=A0A9N7JLW1_CLOSE|nr:6-phospho-beta-glucosidase [Clostridium septicum]AYE35128.1 6-phospho-beta-glucosidase [Clostridium septicum]QAS60520.1 6-phospho-beta-glucosidase [Clostridium septicum]UEC20221.1 6-phospho-beta-glucosidase [Clostridium septicum]USS01725.1 6-phospho-beta-glucosidase [Clostridium septicum]
MKGLKVVTIGGGSSYTPELIEGFIKRYNELPLRELWLVDIEEGKEKLQIVGELAKRMVKKSGLPIDIRLTLDRREALKDADFVTTQIRVGLLEARIKDERIPLSKGYIGQETNGAGGLFKGLRTIPVLIDITKDMKELCPNAWLINFTNPVGMVTEALLKYGAIDKVIGLCNVPIGLEKSTAKILGVDSSRVRIDFAGLNHMVFGLNIYLDGKVVTDKVIKKIIEADASSEVKNIDEVKWKSEFLKGLGVLPCSYAKYYFMKDYMLNSELEKFKENGTRAEVVKKLENELFELYKDKNLNVKPQQLEERGGAFYSDAACRLIDSIYNDRRDIQPVDTMNRGSIADLEYNSAVEVSCIITKDGPKPITVGHLPIQIRGLIQQIKSFEMLGAKAAAEGDYNAGVVAMTINPLVQSDKMAKILFDELLQAHKKYLPQFNFK